MIINILHIDDEQDVLQNVSKIINGKIIRGHTLLIKKSCGFKEGIESLKSDEYDLVILDLCVGKALELSDKIGVDIYEQIKHLVFSPILFFTGLPDYVKDLESDIVRIASKGLGYASLFSEISLIIDTGYIDLKSEVNVIIKEGVRSFFWDFVHPNKEIIAQLQKDQISLKYLLLRRLGKTLSSDVTRSVIDDPEFNTELSHPMEFYVYPPMKGEYETGDILKNKKNKNISIICTPSCDLIQRGDGRRKADRILLVQAFPFTSLPHYLDFEELKQKIEQLERQGKKPSQEELGKIKNLKNGLHDLMGTKMDRHFFLPKTPFLDASLVDFQHKHTISYQELEDQYEIVASLDDPFVQAFTSKYARYYSRVGYRDLDINYSFSKIISKD